MNRPPLVAHVIYRLGVGGLENGLVNLINRMPRERYRHAIVCLKDATDFSERIRVPDVPIHALNKREGHDLALFGRLFKLLRELKPDIVHTRNLAALECQWPAWLAGVPHRVHGEHGWDVFDPGGSNRKYQWLRRLHRPLIHRYIPLSRQIEGYLRETVGIPVEKIRRICNGVDTALFHPRGVAKSAVEDCPFPLDGSVTVVGTVGRMHGVKDQLTLVRAFLRLLGKSPRFRARLRLMLVGEGPLREKALEGLRQAGAEDLAWLPGEREDVAELLRLLDIFVLPSQAEGISNTLLEAMATGLPVVATAVGGNPELVVDGVTGYLVPPAQPEAMATALAGYLDNPVLKSAHGQAGLRRVREEFSLDAMVQRYMAVYDESMDTRILNRKSVCAAS
jgi:sugar transferase (PEP-CTERM/EpsH1 system associated)